MTDPEPPQDINGDDAPVVKDAAYYARVSEAVGRGTPTLLLGTSTRSLKRSLKRMAAARPGAVTPQDESSDDVRPGPPLLFRVTGPSRTVPLAPTSDVPVVGEAAAGAPIIPPEEDFKSVPLPSDYAHRSNVFALKVQGDSLTRDGVFAGDYVIVDQSEEAKDGEMVVVRIDTPVINRLRRDGTTLHLESPDPDRSPTTLGPEDNWSVEGKVLGIFRPAE
jgi:repressor LexA